jgi:phytoene synthase
MTPDLQSAYEHCQRVAREHAKNFYYAFRTLPTDKRNAIYAAYAFCRVCDDIADEDMPPEQQRRLFEETRALLLRASSGTVDDPVFAALGHALSLFDIPVRYFEDVIEGTEMDLSVRRFETFDDLKAYCYKVASAVGLICIEVFGYEGEYAREHAIDLGIAMQLTNILRDVKEDAGRGRIYLPLEDLCRFGYTESELMRGEFKDSFRDLMRFQVCRARRYFEGGNLLVPLVSPESRPCLAALSGVYSALLDRIEDANYQVFDRRISLRASEKLLIVAKLWLSARLTGVPILSRR